MYVGVVFVIRIATIGTNFITERFLEALKEVEGIELTAVFSRTLEKGRAFAAKYHVDKIYNDYVKMAEDPEIDAVYVASPTCCHYEQSMTMIRHGKHVICEKPVCSNQTELEELIQQARENQVIFMEAMKNIHCPGFKILKDHIGKLGKVRQASVQYCQYSSRYDKFKEGIVENAFNPELSNGALMDIGSYCIHFIAALWGEPKRVFSDSIFLENGVDGAGNILLCYGDKQAQLQYSKITDSVGITEIQGEKGCMLVEQTPNIRKISIVYRDGSREELQVESKDNPMSYELQDFVQLIVEEQIEHEYLEASRIEMMITDKVRKQNGIVFPADKRS